MDERKKLSRGILSILDNGTEDMTMSKFFDQQIEEWRSKMIKVYGDQHPYTFYVTAGHDFEDLILKVSDKDAPERELKKHEPFENLKNMSEVDRQAEQRFHEILSNMEKEKPTQKLKEALEEKKKECAKVFAMFDKIVSVCEDYFELEYSDCSKRVSKQVAFQEPVLNEVGKFLLEVEEFGNAELKSLRDRISKWIYDKGLSMLDNVNKSYSLLKDQPFAMTVWFKCTAALTSKEVRSAFLTDQKEMSDLWKKAFDDLLMLSAKLEKCRCNYNLIKFKLEREIFWMNRDYKENMPELTKIQRHLSGLVDQKASLKLEIKNLENKIQSEQKQQIETKRKLKRKILSLKTINKFANQTAVKKFQNVLRTKKEEIYDLLCEILKGDQFIHEEILGVNWNPVDMLHLKPDDFEDKDEFDSELKKIKTHTDIEGRNLGALYEDDFSRAFHILLLNENFMTLLNTMSEELRYTLDFKWVNYIKEKLELSQDVKWIELFKVFKVNFEELKELKEHMISYCKFDCNGEIIFNINDALDGFLNFVWQKRQISSQNVTQGDDEPKDCKDYWISVSNLIPKSLLWDNVEDVLFQYWDLLEKRSSLLKTKFNMIAENSELENCLQNYRKYGTWCV